MLALYNISVKGSLPVQRAALNGDGVSLWLECGGKEVPHDFVQDPDGSYIARWVPELARLPKKHLHQPWAAPAEVLAAAGVKFGSAPGCYPPRITTAVLQVRPTACPVHAKPVQLPSQIPWCRACCYSTQG